MKIAPVYLILLILVFTISQGCKSKLSKGKLTIENLKSSYRNEVNASAQYDAFAQKAQAENYPQIANLYKAISKSESIHARNHKEIMLKLGISSENFAPDFELRTTRENLQISIEGETHESTESYIDYIDIAEKEGLSDAKKSFIWAKDTEMKHTGYFIATLAAIDKNRLWSLPDSLLVCPGCGQTFETRQHDEKCSSCRNPRANFISFP